MSRRARPEPEFRLKRIPGRRYWHIVWSERRRSKKVSTGEEDWTEARAWMSGWLRQRNALPGPKARTVTQVLDGYLEERRLAGVLAYQRLVEATKPLKRHFGAMVPDEITPASIARYDRARGHLSPWTLRKEKQTLRAALRWGERAGWYRQAPEVPLGPMPPPRDRWLDTGERQRLIDGARAPHVRTFIILGLYTGARKGAILGLQWPAVDFDTGLLTYVDPDRPETKKRRATIPMPNVVREELLRARVLAQTTYVIEWNGKPVKDIRQAFARACQQAGLVGVTPHVMRHTCASMLAMKGRPLDEIADFLTISPATVYRIYRKFKPDYLRDAAAALDESAPCGALIREQESNSAEK
ncbi:hypothetical protein LCGC14_0327120 [marine sediment metagenome]|uniref:Tyr recombinase domain-containing protein n=2 Tax=root TaxID=1 RepID=A0A0F9THA8_9ZZZZ